MNLILSTGDNQKELMQAELSPDGSFGAEDLFYYDSVKVYLQPNGVTITDQNKITLWNNLLPADPDRKLSVHRLQPVLTADSLEQLQQKHAAEKRILDSMASSGTLQEVIVTTRVKKRIEEIDEKYTTGLFTSDGIKFDIVSDNFGTVFFDFLFIHRRRIRIIQQIVTQIHPCIARNKMSLFFAPQFVFDGIHYFFARGGNIIAESLLRRA